MSEVLNITSYRHQQVNNNLMFSEALTLSFIHFAEPKRYCLFLSVTFPLARFLVSIDGIIFVALRWISSK